MQFVIIKTNPVLSDAQTFREQVVPSGWSHKNAATLGFDTASFDIQKDKRFLEEMFYYGLGRDVTRYSLDGNRVVFHGYIHEMILTEPGMRARISLENMYNTVAIEYTELDTSTKPPGETEKTSVFSNDIDSRNKYGIKELVFKPPVKKLTSTMALQMRDTVLEQYKNPRLSADYTVSDANPRLHVVVKGYMHTLGWRYYTWTDDSGTRNAEDEIYEVVTVGAMTSGVGQFIDSTNLGSNGTAVNIYKDENRTALETIQSIAAIGDGNYDRWIAHVFDDRKLIYKQASGDIEYYRRLSDPKQQIYDTMRRPVPPWEIRPDAWLRTEDVQPFAVDPSDIKEDTQSMYIESVEWSEANNTLLLTGSKGDEVRVMVARASALGDYVL